MNSTPKPSFRCKLTLKKSADFHLFRGSGKPSQGVSWPPNFGAEGRHCTWRTCIYHLRLGPFLLYCICNQHDFKRWGFTIKLDFWLWPPVLKWFQSSSLSLFLKVFDKSNGDARRSNRSVGHVAIRSAAFAVGCRRMERRIIGKWATQLAGERRRWTERRDKTKYSDARTQSAFYVIDVTHC